MVLDRSPPLLSAAGGAGAVSAVDFERIGTLRALGNGGTRGLSSLRTALRKFEEFQRLRGRTCRVSWPAGESSDGLSRRLNGALAEWAVWLGETSRLKGSTISTYVANVFRAIAVDLGHDRGQSRRLRGISAFYAATKVPGLLTDEDLVPKRLIPAAHLAQWFAAEPEVDPRMEARRASVGLAYAGCFRLGELVAATRGDPHRGLRRGHAQFTRDPIGRIVSLQVRLTANKSRSPQQISIGAASPLTVRGGHVFGGTQLCGLQIFTAWLCRRARARTVADLNTWFS